MKLSLLTASKNKIVSLQYRDRLGNILKAHGRLMFVNSRIVILKNMRTKQYKMVLVDSCSMVKAQKKTTEFPSIIPVVYTPFLNGFKAIVMNIQTPQFIPSF